MTPQSADPNDVEMSDREYALKTQINQLRRLTLNQWAEACHSNAVAHGWWEDEKRNFGELMMLSVTELSEAFEHWRNGKSITDIWFEEDGKPDGVSVELIDVLIRLLDNLRKAGVDVEYVMALKHLYNVDRPHRHGGKRA